MADIVAPDVCDGMSAVGERRLCTPIFDAGVNQPENFNCGADRTGAA